MKCCICTKDIYLSSNITRQNLAKYGLLYYSLCDASVPCTYCSLPYAGKPDLIDDEANCTKYLLNGFYKFNRIKDCNIWMDWYFKLYVPPAKWASENDFTIVGKMRLDHICLPNEIKTMKGREEKSTKYLYKKDGNTLLVSYVDRKNLGKKTLLSFQHAISLSVCVMANEQQKPHVFTFYDRAKGGVDVVDLISSYQSACFKSPRWLLDGFFA